LNIKIGVQDLIALTKAKIVDATLRLEGS
jgi:hypothetical protein